jgi:GntR family transcriptional regulator
MWFDIDLRADTPIYQQLVEGVKKAVATGILQAGDKLPSVRELSTQITINPHTIAKAYQELEREGIIETRRGRGTFVASRENQINQEEKRKLIDKMVDKILIEAFYMGIDEDELLSLIERRVRGWYRQKEEQISE